MGGAGIQQDIRVGEAFGAHVTTALTAVTVQNSKGFYKIETVSKNLLKEQLNCIFEDVTPDAIKIGLIGDIKNIEVIGEFLDSVSQIPVVVDPVLSSTVKGFKALKDYILAYKEFIFPFSTVVTPNLHEFKDITGFDFLPQKTNVDFLDIFPTKSLIVKGGDSDNKMIIDYLITKEGIMTYCHKKTQSQNLHGTGCALSTLIAVNLAEEKTLKEAFTISLPILSKIIEKSSDYQLGRSTYGPLNLNNKKLESYDHTL